MNKHFEQTAVANAKTSEVFSQISGLTCEIDRLESAVTELLGRIGPILFPEGPVPGLNEVGEVVGTTLGCSISTQRKRVIGLNESIDSAISRLGL